VTDRGGGIERLGGGKATLTVCSGNLERGSSYLPALESNVVCWHRPQVVDEEERILAFAVASGLLVGVDHVVPEPAAVPSVFRVRMGDVPGTRWVGGRRTAEREAFASYIDGGLPLGRRLSPGRPIRCV